MKTNVTRAAALHRAPRISSPTQSLSRTAQPAARPVTSDWAWPGLTRAELREMVIEQIG
jgi:hypothetical protein